MSPKQEYAQQAKAGELDLATENGVFKAQAEYETGEPGGRHVARWVVAGVVVALVAAAVAAFFWWRRD